MAEDGLQWLVSRKDMKLQLVEGTQAAGFAAIFLVPGGRYLITLRFCNLSCGI
jgi:hypothetical protein